MPILEFYVDGSAGHMMNAGTTTGSPVLSLTGGDWDGTSVYTKTGAITGVSAGMYAHVYVDGSTTPTYIAKITATTANTITLSTSEKSGFAPTSGTGTRSIRVGGAFGGPSGNDWTPFTLLRNTITTASGGYRVNLKNNTTFNITANVQSGLSYGIIEAFSSTPGDGGRATIDGTSAGASIQPFQINGTLCYWKNLIFKNAAASGASACLQVSSALHRFVNCVIAGSQGPGVNCNSGFTLFQGCEFFNCGTYGISTSGSAAVVAYRCVFHNCTSGGFYDASGTSGGSALLHCIFYEPNNASNSGYSNGNNYFSHIVNCDFYKAGYGISNASSLSNPKIFHIENCNFIKNVRGINLAAGCVGYAINNGYGSGTQANTNADILQNVVESGKVTYASNATVWNAADTGDFSIVLAAAKDAGTMTFTQTQSGYSGTVAYASIGAATPSQSGGGGSTYYGASQARIFNGV